MFNSRSLFLLCSRRLSWLPLVCFQVIQKEKVKELNLHEVRAPLLFFCYCDIKYCSLNRIPLIYWTERSDESWSLVVKTRLPPLMDLFWIYFSPLSNQSDGDPGHFVLSFDMKLQDLGKWQVILSLVFSTPSASLMTDRIRLWGDTRTSAVSSTLPSHTNSHTECLWWLERDYLSLLRGRWGKAKPSCGTATHHFHLNHWCVRVGDSLCCLICYDFHCYHLSAQLV